jgi:hypothetical protein
MNNLRKLFPKSSGSLCASRAFDVPGIYLEFGRNRES